MYVTYTISYGKPIIYVIESKGYYTDTSFNPYFYIRKEDYDKASLILGANKSKIKEISEEVQYNSFPDNKPLLKIITSIPTHVAEIREELHKANIQTYEADVLFHNRYIIDKDLKPTQTDNVLYLDIEVLPPDDSKFPHPKEAFYPVTSICCYSTLLRKYITFYWREDLIDTVERGDKESYYQFGSENEMLNTFLQFINDIKPDVIAGWNVSNFDLTYLYNRMKRLNLPASKLSPIGIVKDSEYEGVVIKGVWTYDLLISYRNFKDLKFYPSLEYVAKVEGLPHKLSIDYKTIWQKDIRKLLEYNKRDVEITKLIDEKYMLLKSDLLWHHLPISQGVQLDDAIVTNKLADFIILKYARKKGLVLPSKSKRTHEKLSGAIVYAKPGLYKNVAVFDFKSMYPNIVRFFNIGADTKIRKEDECRLCQTVCNSEKLSERCNRFYHSDIIALSNQVKFWKRSKKQTIMSELIEELLNLRQRYKDQMKEILRKEKTKTEFYNILDRRQTVIKFFTNAFSYGVSAYPNFRLFDIEVANSITAVGRELNLLIKNQAERLGYRVVLGDTDSVFVEIESVDEAEKVCEKLNTLLNNYLKETYGIDNEFVLEFEKMFSNLLVIAKKRYAGYITWKDGVSLDKPLFTYKGIELRRNDTPKFVKDFQEKLICMILDGATKEVERYIEQLKNEIRNGKFTLNEIGTPGSLTQDISMYKSHADHVSAVRYSNKHLGYNITKGIKFLYTKFKRVPEGYPIPPRGWVAWTDEHPLPEGFIPDYNYIVKTWIDNIAKRILEPAGIGTVKYMDIREFLM